MTINKADARISAHPQMRQRRAPREPHRLGRLAEGYRSSDIAMRR
jgi:hypothetical protein